MREQEEGGEQACTYWGKVTLSVWDTSEANTRLQCAGSFSDTQSPTPPIQQLGLDLRTPQCYEVSLRPAEHILLGRPQGNCSSRAFRCAGSYMRTVGRISPSNSVFTAVCEEQPNLLSPFPNITRCLLRCTGNRAPLEQEWMDQLQEWRFSHMGLLLLFPYWNMSNKFSISSNFYHIK